MKVPTTLTLALLAAGCHSGAAPVRVVTQAEGEGVRLSLVTDAGTRINARLKPALEAEDGRVLRFDSPAVTPDSAYFTAAPELLVPALPHGTVRASVCDTGGTVCRTVEVRL
jgi:hypothetical protein